MLHICRYLRLHVFILINALILPTEKKINCSSLLTKIKIQINTCMSSFKCNNINVITFKAAHTTFQSKE